jgi:transposase
MAATLLDAHQAAQAARAAGQTALDEPTLAGIRGFYRGAVAKGLTDNHDRRGELAREALTLARRFRDHEDMILRFATDLTVDFTNNQAERDVRPVKVQQRSSGGGWRTPEGLADFAVVQSYLSTAAKWGLDKWTAPVILEAVTSGRIWVHGSWEGLPRGAAGTGGEDGVRGA